MRRHKEFHASDRIGWLRAAVLGANDGTISVASLVAGVAAAGAGSHIVLTTGIAGLVSGAMSMAAGEYVSVRSQADAEGADLAREREELRADPEHELEELTHIYMKRGLDRPLAAQVAEKLTISDALGAHARDELGITATFRARPLQAALASAASFAVGALVPIVAVLIAPTTWTSSASISASLAALCLFGAAAAYAGRAPIAKGAIRVVCWGALAMAFTAGVGSLFGVQV